MLDIDNATKTLDKADNFLTKLGAFLKKQWKLLLLLLFCFGIYEFSVLVGKSMDEDAKKEAMAAEIAIEEVEGVSKDDISQISQNNEYQEPKAVVNSAKVKPKLTIVSTYQRLDSKGNERTIEVWSDGVETVKPYVKRRYIKLDNHGHEITMLVWSDGKETEKLYIKATYEKTKPDGTVSIMEIWSDGVETIKPE